MQKFDQKAWLAISALGRDRVVKHEPRLQRLQFAPNPGELGAKMFVPPGTIQPTPLVVVLHGCTQTPEGYDQGAGWVHIAERHGFAVLYPEQQRSNNANGCFNWFEPGDMRRNNGEPASIKAMIDKMVAEHTIDPSRIFITGLSAGAAMANVMLATYPEIFAGGGLIAGLPYGVAGSMPAAFSRMRSRGRETDAQLSELVLKASDHDGPWPMISIWHGTADMTVNASNADAAVTQWLGVHGLDQNCTVEEVLGAHQHRIWQDTDGRSCVEEYVITGMGHGTPLDAANVENAETAGAYLLDVGISSTLRLAESWGLADGVIRQKHKTDGAKASRPAQMAAPPELPSNTMAGIDVQTIIQNALKSAGLMR